ncbi:MAG: fused MFS/spermidine synthase [Bryobacteraceae bacterium]
MDHRAKAQSTLHMALLALSLVLLPILPSPAWKPEGSEDPLLRIIGLLAVTIGLPYFLLSTTGPLVQAWFVRDRKTSGLSPYRLYALSNLGSMLALLSYPVVIEPYLPTQLQGITWSVGYGAFALLCGYTALRGRNSEAASQNTTTTGFGPAPTFGLMIIWTDLAACASTLLLAVSNHLCQNVASIPFLWVLPLALYLLTFILCFDGEGWYRRDIYLRLGAVMIGGMAYALFTDADNMPLKLAVPLFSVGLFAACMVCHGELARLKPDPRYLTSFFLTISVGGAMGGVFVGLLAPRLFAGYFEMPVALVACAVLALIVLRRDPTSSFYQAQWQPVWLICVLMTMGLAGYMAYELHSSLATYRIAVRNFYGGLRVSDSGKGEAASRSLTHGTINHGDQFLDPQRRKMPTTYYGPNSGVGLAVTEHVHTGGMHVGIIGLGTGTMAAYGKPGDRYRFYEINPLVIQIADTEFTYRKDSGAKIDTVLGDARLQLERETPQNFDVLAVDAFSSDSIPVHLLTREAFELYFRHLKPDGALVVHVSNKYLDLKPIVKLAVDALGKQARLIDTDDEEDGDGTFGSTWIVIGNEQLFTTPGLRLTGKPLEARSGLRIWTDDYSNLFGILK